MSNLQFNSNILRRVTPKVSSAVPSSLLKRSARSPKKLPRNVVLLEQKYLAPASTDSNNKEDIWAATPIDRMFLECDARADTCL